MSQQTSIGTMIRKIGGMLDTRDLTPWENQFVSDILDKTNGGDRTTGLSEKQVEAIQRIHEKHFA